MGVILKSAGISSEKAYILGFQGGAQGNGMWVDQGMGGGEDVVHTDLKDGIWLVVKHAGIDNDEPAHSFVFCPSLQPQSGRPDFSCSSCSTTATPGPIILQKGITDADHRAFFVHGILAGEKKQQRAVRSLQPFSLPLPLAIAGNSLETWI